ncbi:MAG: hypothetical protein ABFC57_10360, partial [Veillonellales bacterium]
IGAVDAGIGQHSRIIARHKHHRPTQSHNFSSSSQPLHIPYYNRPDYLTSGAAGGCSVQQPGLLCSICF